MTPVGGVSSFAVDVLTVEIYPLGVIGRCLYVYCGFAYLFHYVSVPGLSLKLPPLQFPSKKVGQDMKFCYRKSQLLSNPFRIAMGLFFGTNYF